MIRFVVVVCYSVIQETEMHAKTEMHEKASNSTTYLFSAKSLNAYNSVMPLPLSLMYEYLSM